MAHQLRAVVGNGAGMLMSQLAVRLRDRFMRLALGLSKAEAGGLTPRTPSSRQAGVRKLAVNPMS